MKLLYAFLGGAIAGAGLALLFAPEKGEDMRAHVKALLRKYGIVDKETEDAIIEQIVADVETARR